MLQMQINLKAILNNINKIHQISNKKVIPVIKSNAYNLGDIEVGKYLSDHGINCLAVVDIEEAKRLLEAQITADILVLNGIFPHEMEFCEQNPNLILSVNSYKEALDIVEHCSVDNLRVHLQIETGMNRLGIKSVEECKEVIALLKSAKVKIKGIYTHFSSLNNLEKQESEFKKYLSLYKFEMVHCAATSTYRFATIGNFVRVGLQIYGFETNDDFTQALTIYTKPIAINNIKAQETVGYNEAFIAPKDMSVAVLPLGYSNGYSRNLSGFVVFAEGKRYPVISRVCMNHLFVAVDNKVNMETKFYITCSELPIKEIATYLNTIEHDVLCMFHIKDREYLR